MSAQTWRIVLADGTVREVVVRAGHSFTDGVGYFARLSPTDTMAFGADPRGAVLRLAVARYLDVAEILSPGEPSRAELTAERDEATRFTAQLSTALADRRALALDAVRDALGATEHEGAVDAAKRVIAQRDAARREGAEAMRKACVTLLWAKARKENDYGDMNPNCRAGEGASERAFALENASVDVANLSAEEVPRG